MASEKIKGSIEVTVGYKLKVNNPIVVRASGFVRFLHHPLLVLCPTPRPDPCRSMSDGMKSNLMKLLIIADSLKTESHMKDTLLSLKNPSLSTQYGRPVVLILRLIIHSPRH